MKIHHQKRSKFREISVSRVLHAGIGPIHGYFRDMTGFKKGHAPCFLYLMNLKYKGPYSKNGKNKGHECAIEWFKITPSTKNQQSTRDYMWRLV